MLLITTTTATVVVIIKNQRYLFHIYTFAPKRGTILDLRLAEISQVTRGSAMEVKGIKGSHRIEEGGNHCRQLLVGSQCDSHHSIVREEQQGQEHEEHIPKELGCIPAQHLENDIVSITMTYPTLPYPPQPYILISQLRARQTQTNLRQYILRIQMRHTACGGKVSPV